MQLGANTVLFGGHDFRTAMQHIKWAGYDAAEISALSGLGAFGDPLGEHLHLKAWKKDVAEIRATVEALSLPHVIFGPDTPVSRARSRDRSPTTHPAPLLRGGGSARR